MDDITVGVGIGLALLWLYTSGGGDISLPTVLREDASLPAGYSTDENVAAKMFTDSMNRHGLNAVMVQHNGYLMVAALKADYPALDVYVHPVTDALMWPGFGSLDTTIDSGLGGWEFRPDGFDNFGEGR